MENAKCFHQQMDVGWTPFYVECQNPYFCTPPVEGYGREQMTEREGRIRTHSREGEREGRPVNGEFSG